MSKIWKNNVKAVEKSNLKQRLELKLTALVAKNLCPNFQNLAPPGKFRVGGPVWRDLSSFSLLLGVSFILVGFF